MRTMRAATAFSIMAAAAVWASACGGDGGTDPTPPTPPANRAPNATGSIAAQTVPAGESVTVDVASNFTDPDGDALTYAASTSNAGVATAAVSGSSVTITGVAAGTATVTVTARDPGGLTATQSIGVTVEAVNRAPEAVGTIEDVSIMVGETLIHGLLAYFSDPDDDELTFSATISDTTVATISVTGETVVVDGLAPGSATVTATATDPGGLSATQEFTVTVEAANRAPEVVDTIPSQTVQSGGSTTVDVSANFSDPDGDELTFAASSSDTTVATVSVSGATVAVEGVAPGSATVTVTAMDPSELSVEASFAVTVTAPAPTVADTIPTHDMIVDSMVPLDVAPYFAGGDLTYTVTVSDETIAVASVDGSTVTTKGVGAVEDSISVATLSVTATNAGGSVTQDSIMVRVHQEKYDSLPGISINEDGNLTADLGTGTPSVLAICLNVANFPLSGELVTIYWSEWQRAVGSGWVTVQDNVRPGPPPTNICPIRLSEEQYPPGIYRMVGHVKFGDEASFYTTPTIEKKSES